MAEIRFLPVCSNCNWIITEEVGIEETTRLGNPVFNFYEHNFYERQIFPCKCKQCGAYFDSIIIPSTLPFQLKEPEDGT